MRGSDMEAFRVLFDRYQPIIFRQALFRTREIDLSHDVVQETFLRIWERRSALKPHLSFLAYALRISENIIRDTFRHRKTRQRLEARIPPPAVSVGDDPAESLQLTMLQEKLSAVINESLPERCRLVFTLSRFEGKSNQEIADLLKISVKTVENQIGHALKVMRKKMKGYGK
jgi:RNA polymerase sigma-70 factor (ECF subfamily)